MLSQYIPDPVPPLPPFIYFYSHHLALAFNLIKCFPSNIRLVLAITSMSNFKSQDLNLASKTPNTFASEPWFLNAQDKFPSWKKHLYTQLSFAWGTVGKHIVTKDQPPLPPVDIQKTFHDRATNPISNKPIRNKWYYPRKEKTQEQTDEGSNFSDDDLEPTDAALVQYASDKSRIEKQQATQDAKIQTYVKEDNALLTYIHATMSSPMWDLLGSHPSMRAWNTPASNSFDRSAYLLAIMHSQFVKGGNIFRIRQVAELLALAQPLGQPIHEFTSLVQDKTADIFPLIEDPANPGYVKLATLKCMIVINGACKDDPNIIRALTTILDGQHHQELDKPEELIQALNQSHYSDLNRTPTSAQSSAFTTRVDETSSAFAAATSLPPTPRKPFPKKGDSTYGMKDPTRGLPCANCLRICNKYFYHKTEKCRTVAPPSPAYANVAEIPPTTAPAQSEAERYANFQAQALHFGYSIPLEQP